MHGPPMNARNAMGGPPPGRKNATRSPHGGHRKTRRPVHLFGGRGLMVVNHGSRASPARTALPVGTSKPGDAVRRFEQPGSPPSPTSSDSGRRPSARPEFAHEENGE